MTLKPTITAIVTAITIQVNHFAYLLSLMRQLNLNVMIRKNEKIVKDGRRTENVKRKSFGKNVKKLVENVPKSKYHSKPLLRV